jgi:PAS domain S-box-containing protein
MRVVFINRKGAELLGRDRSEIIGADWFDRFVPADMRRELRARFERMLRGAEPGPVEDFPVLASEGVSTPVEWRLVVIKDDAGNRTGVFGAGRLKASPARA